MAYCTAAEVKTRIDKTYTDDDALITAIIAGAQQAIDKWTNHPDGFEALASATARRFVGSGKAHQFIDECVEITKVEVKDSATDTTYTEWSSGDYIACLGDPYHPTFDTLPYDLLVVDISGDESHFTDGNVGSYGGGEWDGYSFDTYIFSHSQRTAKHVVPGQPTVRVTAKWGYSVTVPPIIREACAMQSALWYKKFQGAGADTLASSEFGQIPFAPPPMDRDVKMMLWLARLVKPATGRR